ncbi:MAG: universal stress protein [Pseudomonadota bacterium]
MELLEDVITQGEKAMEMHKVLIPVDGSSNALKAVQRVVSQVMKNQAMEVHLLHVRTPLSRHISRFVSKRNRAAFHRDEANKALRSARELLDRFGVPYAAHAELGDKAQVIAGVARRLHVDQIIMGTARKNSFTRMVEDSVTNKVLELATVPVEVIAGDSISNYERIGVPAGIGATLALLYIAAE